MSARLAALAIAGPLLLLRPATADSMRLRTCDGRWRHVTCHWSGGDRASEFTVSPDEQLAYGPPSVALTDHGRIHLVVGACEISCDAEADTAQPSAQPR